MQYAVLAAFLVIDDELNGNARIVWPIRLWCRSSITMHVTGISHGAVPPRMRSTHPLNTQIIYEPFPQKILKVLQASAAYPGTGTGCKLAMENRKFSLGGTNAYEPTERSSWTPDNSCARYG